jgi:hypothetical protein
MTSPANPPKNDLRRNDGVSNDEKYRAACDETVARIEARDRVIEGFVALSAAVVGFSLAEEKHAMFGVAVGYIALAAAFLSRHHDAIIGLLGAFQNELCANDDNRSNWFSDDYFEDVLKERGYRDISLALIFTGGAIFGLGVAWKRVTFCQFGDARTIIWCLGLASFIGSLVVVYWTHRTRQALHTRVHPHHAPLRRP